MRKPADQHLKWREGESDLSDLPVSGFGTIASGSPLHLVSVRIWPVVMAFVLITVVLLSGCSGKSSDADTDPSITYPSAQASDTDTSATIPPLEELYPYPKAIMPLEAEEHTLEGAQAFSKYFLELHAYAVTLRDADMLKEVCLDQAPFCNERIKLIDHLNEEGSYFKNFGFEDVEIIGSLEGGSTPNVEWGTQIAAYSPAYSVHRRDGSEEESLKSMKIIAGVEVQWLDGWKVSEAQLVPYESVYDD